MGLQALEVLHRDRLLGTGRQQRGNIGAVALAVDRGARRGGGPRGADQQRLGVERGGVAGRDHADPEAREGIGGGAAGLRLARHLTAVGDHGGAAHGAERRQRGGISLAHTGGCDCHGVRQRTCRLAPAADGGGDETRRPRAFAQPPRKRAATTDRPRALQSGDHAAAVRPRPVAGAVGDVRRQRAAGAAPAGPRRARAGRATGGAPQPRGARRRRRPPPRPRRPTDRPARPALARPPPPAGLRARPRAPAALGPRGVGAAAARAGPGGAAHPASAATSTCTRTSPPARRWTRCASRRSPGARSPSPHTPTTSSSRRRTCTRSSAGADAVFSGCDYNVEHLRRDRARGEPAQDRHGRRRRRLRA